MTTRHFIDLVSSDDEDSKSTAQPKEKPATLLMSSSVASTVLAPITGRLPGSGQPPSSSSSSLTSPHIASANTPTRFQTTAEHFHNGNRKRNAQDAFGRNGVLELLKVAKAETFNNSKTAQTQTSTQASTTPGRTSIEQLLARSSEGSEDRPLSGSVLTANKRPRADGQTREYGTKSRPVDNGVQSLASLVAKAQEHHDVGKQDQNHVLHKSNPPSTAFRSVASTLVFTSKYDAKTSKPPEFKAADGNPQPGTAKCTATPNHEQRTRGGTDGQRPVVGAQIRSKTGKDIQNGSRSQQSTETGAQATRLMGQQDSGRVISVPSAHSLTSSATLPIQNAEDNSSIPKTGSGASTRENLPSAQRLPPAVHNTSNAVILSPNASNISWENGEVKHMVQNAHYTNEAARDTLVFTSNLAKPRGIAQASTELGVVPAVKATRISSPKLPDHSRQQLDRPGTSPRLVGLPKTSGSDGLVDETSKTTKHLSSTLTSIENATLSAALEDGSSHRPVTRPTYQEPIQQSIEVPPPDVFPAIASPSTASRVPTHAEHTLQAIPITRRFHESSLSGRARHPWTDAEVILTAYLHEVLRLNWNTIDKMMDRGYNTCITKYSRVPNGLKNTETKATMRWRERKRAIDALLRTQDLDMEGMFRHVVKYLDTDSLPAAAADEYARLEMLDLDPALHVPVSTMHNRMMVSGSSRVSSESGADSVVTTVTRKRRGAVEGKILSERLRPGARLTEVQRDLKALNQKQDTPDSVLVATDREASTELNSSVLPQQTTLLFRLGTDLSDNDEDRGDMYVHRKRPYLSSRERIFTMRAIAHEARDAHIWQGTTLHVDFSIQEVLAVVEVAEQMFSKLHHQQLQDRLHQMLVHATKAQLAAITAWAVQDERLRGRTRRSIMGFMADVVAGGPPLLPSTNLKVAASSSRLISANSVSSRHLLHRELGVDPKKSSKLISRDKILDTMNVTRTWTGASGDVGNLAWSPHGTHFVAGSVCLVDTNSMQYNEPNNLLFGNIDQNTLYEVPNHHRLRTKPERGVNATHSMHISQDPRLFETVSMVNFSRDGKQMFSVGYDNHLRSYRVDGDRGNCTLVTSQNHGAKIDLLAMHPRENVLATGCQDLQAGVRVFSQSHGEGLLPVHRLFSSKAQSMPDKQIYPSALKWGAHSSVSQYLMAGFSSNAGNNINIQTAYGEVCLWDVVKNVAIPVAPASGNIFDCSWNPRTPHFVTAGAASGNVNRGTKSVVRVFNALEDAGGLRWTSRGLEMECPALDINDVLFNPHNDREVVAGATNGVVYVWDLRRPDSLMHQFSHGTPLMELDPNCSRELLDTGIRFCAWGDRAARLYTGSSDGVLKVWDTRRATDDAHVMDVATFNSGIMSGAFTEDFSKLLIGEVSGSINLLEVGVDPKPIAELERFTLQPFESADAQPKPAGQTNEDSGAAAAWNLWSTGRITYERMGGYPKPQAVQGAWYDGPFDQSPEAPLLRQRAQAFQRSMMTLTVQCSLPLCHDAGRHFAPEETEGSERSRDRIPQALRDALGSSRAGKMPSTMLKCTHCDAPARVREDDTSQASFPLCERCSFGCFRCGKACSKISPAIDVVGCRACGLEWDIDVLGFQVRDESKGANIPANKYTRVWVEKEGVGINGDDDGALVETGDLFDLVKEYHHSLWEDRVVEE